MAFKRSAVRSRLSPPKEIRFRKEADFLLCRKFQFPGVFRETLATYLDKTIQHSKIHKIPGSGLLFPGSQNSPGFIAEKVKLYPNINYYQPLQKACRAERLSCLEYGIHADFFRQDADGITVQRQRSMEI